MSPLSNNPIPMVIKRITPIVSAFAEIPGIDIQHPTDLTELWIRKAPIEGVIDFCYPITWSVEIERGSNEGHYINLVVHQDGNQYNAIHIRSHNEDLMVFKELISQIRLVLDGGISGVLTEFSLAA